MPDFSMDTALDAACARLRALLTSCPAPALALSGGVDSAALAWAALDAGCRVRAYLVRTPFQPAFELEDAQKLAASLGLPLTVLEADTLIVPDIAANGPRRCYHCKRLLMTTILQKAAADGCAPLLDGTNASDRAEERPGQQALQELGVRSPLREAGLDKTLVRALARRAGLSCWDKPAYACLATRTPTGTKLTVSDLARTEAAEAALLRLGFRDFRVRLRGERALLQVRREQWQLLTEARAQIEQALAAYPGGYEVEERR